MTPTTSLNAGLGILDYRFVPEGAFDAAGNVRLPTDFTLPQSWSETVGQVTSSPDWTGLLQILGIMTVRGTDWYCWKVAVSFQGGQLRVVLVRDIGAAKRDQAVALNWSNNVWSTVLGRLKGYAGRRKVLPQWLGDAVANTAEAVKSSEYWNKPIQDDQKRQARDYTKWQVSTALGLVTHVAQLVFSITASSKVLSTVLWYDASNGSISADRISWSPLHQLYDGFNMRAIHYWWNSAWEATNPQTYPFVYGSDLKRRGWGVTDVAHHPWDMARALYPNGNWPDLDQPSVTTPSRRPPCMRVRDPDGGWTWECLEGFTEAAEVPSIDDEHALASARSDPVDTLPLEQVIPVSQLGPGETTDRFEASVAGEAATRPVVVAHHLPALGGAQIGPGQLSDGVWFPDQRAETFVPESIWLPSLERVADADGWVRGWRPTSPIPQVTLLEPAPPEADDDEDRAAEARQGDSPEP